MNEPFIGTIIKLLLVAFVLGVIDLAIYLTAPVWEHLYEVSAIAAIVVWGAGRSIALIRKRGSR